MTLWTAVRDAVLARVREAGRSTARLLVEALRARVAAGRVVLVVGSWRQVELDPGRYFAHGAARKSHRKNGGGP